jgi:hypothetical protein
MKTINLETLKRYALTLVFVLALLVSVGSTVNAENGRNCGVIGEIGAITTDGMTDTTSVVPVMTSDMIGTISGMIGTNGMIEMTTGMTGTTSGMIGTMTGMTGATDKPYDREGKERNRASHTSRIYPLCRPLQIRLLLSIPWSIKKKLYSRSSITDE